MKVFAVHGEFKDLDKYQRFEATQLTGSGYATKVFEERESRKVTRGISSRNFNSLIKLIDKSAEYPGEPLVIITWGGPMYTALRGRMASFSTKHISLVDMSVAIERLLFTTDIDILSESLGIDNEYSTAKKILEVYRNIRHLTKELQYVIDIHNYRKETTASYEESKSKYRHLHTVSAVMKSLRNYLDREVYYINKLAEETSEENAYGQRLKILESQYLRRSQKFSHSARKGSLLHYGSYTRRDTGILKTVPEMYNDAYNAGIVINPEASHMYNSQLSLQSRALSFGSVHFSAYKTMYVKSLDRATTVEEILESKAKFQKAKSVSSL